MATHFNYLIITKIILSQRKELIIINVYIPHGEAEKTALAELREILKTLNNPSEYEY